MIVVIFVIQNVWEVFIFIVKCFGVDQILFDSFVSLYRGQLVVHCAGFRMFLNEQFVNLRMWLNFAMSVTQLLFSDDHSSTCYFPINRL